jgi:ABC-type glycerol-3-phosphate transport system substrate-binding protein
MLALNLALASADGPDIIVLANNILGLRLAASGTLEDLNPYFDQNGIGRRKYLENVLNAYDVEGNLFWVITDFLLEAIVGHESKLEGRDRWTVEEMIAWAEGYPEAKLMNRSAYEIMQTFIFWNVNKYIDWERGSVDFMSDEFIRILEFAATFGNEPDPVGTHEGLANGDYLLERRTVWDLSDMQLSDAMFDGEAQYIGFPMEDGTSGIQIQPINSVAINANSPQSRKEGAFAFISYLLSDAYQVMDVKGDTDRFFIPLKRSGVEALITFQTTKPSWEYLDWERPISTRSWDDLAGVEIYYSCNRDYVETFYDLLARAEGLRYYDINVANIISEETAAFFAGQKTAQEVAAIIQSRVQVYVNENR